jgi:UDP-3-O-[3-hydroxymyristoyl] glucosamine N-acyltransferase
MSRKTLTGQDVAAFLKRPLHGISLPIIRPADLEECGPGTVVWVKSFTEGRLRWLEGGRPALVICDPETGRKTTVPHIVSENPRLDFIKTVTEFFQTGPETGVHSTVVIKAGALIGQNVSIGAFSRIGGRVCIGDDCLIGSGVALEGDVVLGRRCVIKPNSVIGGQGFGFEYDENDTPLHFPHFGKIVIEDEVWIGACTTIELGTLGATTLKQGCKIDDLVQIGHNVTVGPKTLIMANAVICGCVVIGERCWIAPNSVIKEKVRIGHQVTVGLGSVVLRDVGDGLTVAGVPAKPISKKG